MEIPGSQKVPPPFAIPSAAKRERVGEEIDTSGDPEVRANLRPPSTLRVVYKEGHREMLR